MMHFSLFFLIMNLAPLTSNAASSPITKKQQSSFLHSTVKPKRKHSSLEGDSRGNVESNKSSRNASRKRTKPSHLSSPQQSSGNTNQPQTFIRPKTGLSNMCAPLDGPVGAPPLPVLTTKDPSVIERWLEDNVNSDGSYTMLGFDQESIAKPPWMPERTSLPDGPATLQLSTPTSCIIIQLSRCGDGSALYAPEIVRRVINNPKIIKVGVGIDDDALELYRWSKKRFESAPGKSVDEHQQSQLWEMTSRFDIGCILGVPNNKRSGIRELAQKILGVEINKSKKLSMSNWGNRHLTLEQISYAARDAWVSAAVIERLQQSNNDIFRAESLMEMEFMKRQRSMDDMDARAKARKAAKLNLKEVLEGQMKDVEGNGKEKEERICILRNLLEFYRPDQPPAFREHVLNFPLL